VKKRRIINKRENEQMTAALLLLPNLLSEVKHHEPYLPASVDKAVKSLNGLIAESAEGGLRYLKRFLPLDDARKIPIALYNEHTPDDVEFLLEPIRAGERWGLISDAGLPCIADPGAKLVSRARQSGIVVQAFVGPSSMLLALMLSGLPGQKFSFLGYLGKDPITRKKEIGLLEKRALADGATQIFIEAPYRNKHTLESLLEVLSPETLLCVAWDLTLNSQGIVSQPVHLWKKSPLPNIEKKPAIFLVAANGD
jgi:16S rRNA (cytidine1402-2'-O)-methyltransferase